MNVFYFRKNSGSGSTGFRGKSCQFYDLTAHPFELESRPDDPDYAQTVAALKQQLNALESCAGASCFVADAPEAHKVGETWKAGDRTVTIAQAIQ